MTNKTSQIGQIPKPDYPNRAGVAALDTARLAFVALFCILQYWLLTATLEAYEDGNKSLPLGSFIASLACFVLAAGLVLTGELALHKQQRFLRSNVASKSGGSGSAVPEDSTHD